MLGSKARFIEGEYQSSRRWKGPKRAATGVSKSGVEGLGYGGLMGLLVDCFNLIKSLCAYHPIRFLSSTCHVGKVGGLLPG